MERETLAGLRRLPGVAATFLVDRRGLLESGGRGAGGELSQAQGALLAAMVGALRQATADLGIGDLGETILEAESGAIVACALADGQAVVALADGNANLGLIRLEMRRLRRAT